MVDPTAIEIDFDPTVQRMKGVTVHGGMPFDVPIISEIGPNLWQGGCQDGLILPCFVRHLVSLYLWEHYRVQHELDSRRCRRRFVLVSPRPRRASWVSARSTGDPSQFRNGRG